MAGRIEGWLRADASCAENSLLLLKDLRPSTIEAFELAAELFELLEQQFRRSNVERGFADTFEQAAQQLHISVPELDERIETSDQDPVVVTAREADERLIARVAQRYAFHLAWRGFRWGATDLRRLRLTSINGHMRQQAEAVGLIALFAANPASVANRLLPRG